MSSWSSATLLDHSGPTVDMYNFFFFFENKTSSGRFRPISRPIKYFEIKYHQ